MKLTDLMQFEYVDKLIVVEEKVIVYAKNKPKAEFIVDPEYGYSWLARRIYYWLHDDDRWKQHYDRWTEHHARWKKLYPT